ncbi:MAG TPA: plastocyanin/azurin family copper-binding protein [Nitrososphaeraceae archaeon]|nr:plastocyanin/azurin family copper-binding protein [Nitrososphaeraceae archaeon]
MKVIISRLIIMTSIIMLAMGLLANPIKTTTITPVFSQEEGSSVSIAPGAADPNNELSFDPPQINVPTGTIVSWTNADSIQHTVTSDEQELFDAGPISPGDTFENVFDSAGEFGYHCAIHPFMTGVVIVG